MRRTFTVSSLLLLAACSSMQTTALVAVPDNIKASANETLARVVPAKGVQIYECRASTNKAGTYEWAFVAPEADLFDRSGNKIGTHYAGPHWESADGSKLVGKVKSSAPAPGDGAIPWLLLAVKSVGTDGSFSKINSIQRVNTVGGVAPKGGCSQSAVGTTERVPYTADYYFLSAK